MKRPALSLLAAVLASTTFAQTLPGPCTDFYAHVNGRWLAETAIPDSRSRIGSFDDLRTHSAAQLQQALLQLDAKTATTPGLRHAATVWASGHDEAAIERAGLKALAPLLARIDGLETREQLPAVLAALARSGVAAPLAMGVRPDTLDTRRYSLFLAQGGLTLPDRDDYTRTDARLREAGRAYRAALLGVEAARLDALEAFEARLADASTPRVDLRNPRANYHPHLAASLAARAPGLDWSALIRALDLPAAAPARFVVGQPAFLAEVARLAQQADLATWRDYLRLRLIDSYAAALPQRYRDAHFAFYGTAQRGLKQPEPASERLAEIIGGRYGGSPLAPLLGEVFVKAAFPAEAARRSAQLVDDIKEAMRERVRGLTWMSAATKDKALAKLDAMALKIGAPARWPNYQGLVTRPDDFAGNLLRGAQWQSAQRFADLGRPVDRSRWNTSPHIVNAFAGGLNEIVFPAAILQPPFFDANADDASNFGGIGMVIGHEITHHFDDRGRQFDGAGNLADWWTEADAAAYKARAEQVVRLYSGFEALPGQFVNGALTQGENISDLGGLQIAYEGLLRSLKRNPPAPRADGLSPQQAFFVNQALIWRSKYRQEFLIQQLRTDSHSPPRFRVMAPMAHSAAFAEAFACKPGDPMVATPRITVW